MSIMYISEYTQSGLSPQGAIIGVEPSTDQHISFTGTAGQSAAFANNTSMVRITLDGIGSIAFGTNPTAVASQSKRLSAGIPEYFIVPFGAAWKVSAVTTTV